MKFFYENCMGDNGIFSEKDLIKAIYTAWNIEANLYLLKDNNIKKIKDIKFFGEDKNADIIFAPWDGNEFNSDILKPFGYYMEDGEEKREIKEISTGKVVKYDWAEVKQLV